MDAAWVDTVSDLWKDDDPIDFIKLEKEHQLLAFEARGSLPYSGAREPPGRQPLLICLTGFGHQRDEIAEKIAAHGGKHTDDLTRRCTHLVVSRPEGKKFTAAKSWNVRTVTLDWLNQSAERGMILEEDKFDPLLSAEEQGVGAWIKKDPRRQSLGKRSRSAVTAGGEEGTRKLRKTASMKLSSQRNNLWGDILGRSDSREYSFAQEHETEAPVKQEKQTEPVRAVPAAPAAAPSGIFSNCIFYIYGFNEKRTSVLTQTIKSLDGLIASTLFEAANSNANHSFLIVPQNSQPDEHPQLPSDGLHVITEFYVEKCLHNRTFFDPADGDALGRPFPLFPIPGFSNLTVCTAAFTGIELSQVSRSVTQLGARYDEEFRQTTSVLVCKSLESMRKEKLRAALKWGVPVVTADWLWECISTGYNVPLDDFIYPEVKGRLRKKSESSLGDAPAPKPVSRMTERSHSEALVNTAKPPVAGMDPTAFDHDSPRKQSARPRSKNKKLPMPQDESAISAEFTTARTQPAPPTVDPPLTELSSASLNQSPSPPKSAAPSKQQPATRTKSDPTPDKPASKEDTNEQASADDEAEVAAAAAAAKRRAAAKDAERQALTSKLTTLLDSTAASAGADDTPNTNNNNDGDSNPASHPAPRPRKRQILGRAISNVSAGSSAASAPAASVAVAAATMGLDHGHEDAGEEGTPPPPQMTQIGYLDPEAQDHKAALMDRMMGGSGDLGKTTKAAANKASVVSGRSLRRR